jgi:hypothetical protein
MEGKFGPLWPKWELCVLMFLNVVLNSYFFLVGTEKILLA